MAEEIGFENGRNSNFEGLVTLTLDPAIRHTVVHHSSTSTIIPNFIQIEETFCGRTDVRTDISPSNIIRSTFGSRPKKTIGRHFNEILHTFSIVYWFFGRWLSCTYFCGQWLSWKVYKYDSYNSCLASITVNQVYTNENSSCCNTTLNHVLYH